MAYVFIGAKTMWNIDLWSVGNQLWLMSQFAFSLLLVPIVIYVVSRLNHRYINKSWVRLLITNLGGGRITEAMAKLKELDEFKQERSS